MLGGGAARKHVKNPCVKPKKKKKKKKKNPPPQRKKKRRRNALLGTNKNQNQSIKQNKKINGAYDCC